MTAIALTIAGSDSGGGAGIQADLAAFRAFDVYGTTAITAVTAQNTLGIMAIHAVPSLMLAAQIEAVLDDFEVGAVKIGMIPSPEHVAVIAGALSGRGLPIVLDPVMSASSGKVLGGCGTLEAVRDRLFPLAACITPNLPEAAMLLGEQEACDEATMIAQARTLLASGARAVLLKGGHGHLGEAVDVLVSAGKVSRLAAPWIETPNLHGTGCALSSAVAAGLARGRRLEDAAGAAKDWLHGRLRVGAAVGIGRGNGPAVSFRAV